MEEEITGLLSIGKNGVLSVRNNRLTYFVTNKNVNPLLIGNRVKAFVSSYDSSLPMESDYQTPKNCTVKRGDKLVTVKENEIVKKGEVVIYAKPRREAEIGDNSALLARLAAIALTETRSKAIALAESAPTMDADY